MVPRTEIDNQFTEWHSVRPWHPTLSLSVREITSVSVTFVLSSPYSADDAAKPDPSLASLGLSSSDDDELSRDSTSTADTDQGQIVTDIVVKGLSVKVNGTPWHRVILRIDDVLDEAIIIVHGLMPARQYDVELGIVPGEASVRGQITTDTETRSDPTLSDARSEGDIASSPELVSIPLSSPSSHANGGAHAANSHNPPQSVFTLEDRRAQLTHTLSILTAEHTSLTTALKSARRESQKADAALRAEIDTLKRASDRHAAGESRARKKVLALQEAVKQTFAATQEIEALVLDIEAALPVLEDRKKEVEREWEQVRGEAARVRARREEAESKEKARAEVVHAELAGMVNRLEKLNGKREKLEGEGGVIAELEERLRKLEEERERVEKDPYGYEGDAVPESDDSAPRPSGERAAEDGSSDGDKPPHVSSSAHHNSPGSHPHPHTNNFHPHQHPRKRHSHPHMPHHPHSQPQPHPHPRPSFPPPRSLSHQQHQHHQDPIHRPPNTGPRASFPPQSYPVPGVLHIQPHGNPHKNHGRGPLRPNAHGSSGSSSASSTVGTATPSPSAGAGGSALSGRAPAFEPGRARAHSQSQSQSQAALKSDLNPGSTPFAPRSSVAQAVASAAGASTSGPSVPGRAAPA